MTLNGASRPVNQSRSVGWRGKASQLRAMPFKCTVGVSDGVNRCWLYISGNISSDGLTLYNPEPFSIPGDTLCSSPFFSLKLHRQSWGL